MRHARQLGRPNSKARLRKIYSSLYLDPHQAAALRALHAKTRIPSQVLMRHGIDLMLREYSHGAVNDKEQLAAFMDGAAQGKRLSRASAREARAALRRLLELP